MDVVAEVIFDVLSFVSSTSKLVYCLSTREHESHGALDRIKVKVRLPK